MDCEVCGGVIITQDGRLVDHQGRQCWVHADPVLCLESLEARQDAIRARAAEVLVVHQRHGSPGCLCGWSILGLSHADHQVDALVAAGLLGSRR